MFYVCNGRDGLPGATPTVTAEPPGLNCPAGGIRIALGTASAYFACNGLPGTPGPIGPGHGPGGPSRTRWTRWTRRPRQDPQALPGPTPTACSSTRRNARWILIVRGAHRVRNVRVTFEGVRSPNPSKHRIRDRRAFMASAST